MIKLIDSDFISAPAAARPSTARRPATRLATNRTHRQAAAADAPAGFFALNSAGSDFSALWHADFFDRVESRLTRYHE